MWDTGSEKELEELLHEIKLALPRYRMFENSSQLVKDDSINE
jgi:ribosomal protein L29